MTGLGERGKKEGMDWKGHRKRRQEKGRSGRRVCGLTLGISGPGGKAEKGGGFDILIPGGGAGETSDAGRSY